MYGSIHKAVAVRSFRCIQGLQNIVHKSRRGLASQYPIDDDLYGLQEQEKQTRHLAHAFCQKEIVPIAAEIDRINKIPDKRGLWKKLGNAGLLGITIKPEYGGSGMTYFDEIIAFEEINRASASIGLSAGAHTNLCADNIQRNGTEEQKMKYLPKLCSGEIIGGLAMSEAQSGSDVISMKLKAEKRGDHYVLNGSKFWITNGPDADVFLVYAKTDTTTKHPQHGISAFIIERNFKGFSTGKPLDKLGLRGSSTGELIFDNCIVPESQLLGKLNRGAYVLFSGLESERLVIGTGPVGLMQAACDIAFDYVHNRKQFGTKIGEFQLMQGKIADMYTDLSASRSYLYTVARAYDKGKKSAKDCAAVALFCSERATQVCLEAIQCLGGNGYISDYPTGRLLRDAKLYEIGAGTVEIRRLIIGRAINGEYK